MKKNKFIAILSKENSAKIFFSILFVYFFSLNIYQMHNQHWTAMLDQDIKIIYNSLLISSGIEQEYRDHPAYTTFMILGSLFKICSIFFDNFTFNETLGSTNIDKEFQKLFYIARIVNSFYIFLIVFLIYKILIELKISHSLSILASTLSLFFISFYELLFLLRSEAVSVLMFLSSFYFLVKFLNYNKIFHIILTGFFFCLAMLAKIQVIFLYLTVLLALPSLIYYLDSGNNLNKIIKKSRLLILNKIILILSVAFYIFYQNILARNFLDELENPIFSFLHNEDLIFLSFLVLFYVVFIKLVSKNSLINFNQIIIVIGMILAGFILTLISVFLMDYLTLIPFHDLNLVRVLNPIKFMTQFTFEMSQEVSIFQTIKQLFQYPSNELTVQFNKEFNPTILNIDTKVFFRSLQIIILLSLILFSSLIIKNKNHIYLSIIFLGGSFVYHLTFLLRETHGYNIFIFPLYVLIISLLLDKLKKKYVFVFSSLFIFLFLVENLISLNAYKNIFNREPRVYTICGIEKWKNSENYILNYNSRSYIPLVEHSAPWLKFYTKRFSAITDTYCNQLKNEEGNRQTKFKIN